MGLNIKLSNGFVIEATPYGFIMKQKRICGDLAIAGKPAKNAGKEIEVSIGEYTTIESAMTGYLNHAVRCSECQSIEELQVFIGEVKKEISRTYK